MPGDEQRVPRPPESARSLLQETLAICQRMAARAERVRAVARMPAPVRPNVERWVPPLFRWAILSAPELVQRCPERAVRIGKLAVACDRVVLVGPSGAGKTSLATAMLRASTRWDRRWMPARALACARAAFGLGDGEPPLVERALACDLLLLDDLGSENRIPTSPVADVIAERHERLKATWVTTWMRENDVAQRYGEGIARRLFEGATVIDCGDGK